MPRTYNDVYINTRKKLREAEISSPGLEARLLVASAAGKTMDAVLRDMSLYTSDEIVQKTEAMLERRLKGEPVAYITGNWEFYGLPILVNQDVLIPRNDSEVLVDTAVKALRGRKMDARIIDLCTGSGCVGCAIARELPATHVLLADNSPAALQVAKQNVLNLKLNPRVKCMELNAMEAPPMMIGSFDLLVCNPPYIPSADILKLESSVKEYEPMAALDGGEDGLDFYRVILQKWCNVVRIGGAIMFEVGIHQAEVVMELMRAAGLDNVASVKDSQGIERLVYGSI